MGSLWANCRREQARSYNNFMGLSKPVGGSLVLPLARAIGGFWVMISRFWL